jgi:hypothetical protein
MATVSTEESANLTQLEKFTSFDGKKSADAGSSAS